jgi:hypothetical protein
MMDFFKGLAEIKQLNRSALLGWVKFKFKTEEDI